MEPRTEATTTAIRAEATRLFAAGEIDLFIGFERGTIPPASRPCFITAEEASAAPGIVDRLVWDSFCANNLAAYLQRYFENEPNRRKKREKPYPRIAITVKGCDCRSVFNLVKERQVRRESVRLIGIPCDGMVDRRALAEACEGELIGVSEEADGKLSVETDTGESVTLDREAVLQRACVECLFPVPEGSDLLIDRPAREPGDGGRARIDEFERRPSEERWSYFESELAKCIRCNACRQACPTCWCRECFADQNDRKWIGASSELSEAMVFQITRIYHQAGRCVSCDACYNACPMGVDLRIYTGKIVREVHDLFGYLPDFSTETTPPLSTFSEADSDDFITDPEQHTHG